MVRALTIYKPGKKTDRTFDVPADALEKLKKTISQERYFSLPKTIGKDVPDGGKRRLIVKTEKEEKEITIMFIDEDQMTEKDRAAAKAALRIWKEVRKLFDDDDAAK